jgi:hypothetical protein
MIIYKNIKTYKKQFGTVEDSGVTVTVEDGKGARPGKITVTTNICSLSLL